MNFSTFSLVDRQKQMGPLVEWKNLEVELSLVLIFLTVQNVSSPTPSPASETKESLGVIDAKGDRDWEEFKMKYKKVLVGSRQKLVALMRSEHKVHSLLISLFLLTASW